MRRKEEFVLILNYKYININETMKILLGWMVCPSIPTLSAIPGSQKELISKTQQ